MSEANIEPLSTKNARLKRALWHPSTGLDTSLGLLMFLLIVFLVFLGLYQLQPPSPVPASAPLTEFASGRAMENLEAIAQHPHPIGSPEQANVRRYILEKLTTLGLKPEIQATMGFNQAGGMTFAGSVHNVVARVAGANPTRAVLLMAHYDSVPNGPGASDNGAAVVTLLETARALSAGPALKNDVIFLFSDGEEVGLLGATAFVREHPWAKDVGVVVNFEARGTSGPAMLFETSPENGWLIKEFAAAAPYPRANSLAYEIYRLLPNDTDFTVFKNTGFAGLNIAFINRAGYYHTQHDNLANVDEHSLQHHGSYALALARHLGNLPLTEIHEANQVYFDLLGLVLVHYPEKWVMPLLILAILLFVGVMVLGLRKGRLTLARVGIGALVLLLNLLVAPGLVTLIWYLIQTLQSRDSSLLWSNTYSGDLYLMGFVALTLTVISLAYTWFQRKITLENLALGGLLWWLIAAVLTSIYLPGGSYLFIWPLLFSLMGWAVIFVLKDQTPIKRFVILSLSAIPAIVLLAPTIYMIFVAMSLTLSGAVIALVVLLMGLLMPQLNFMTGQNSRLLPAASALISLSFIVAGSLTSGFDATHPQPNSIFYGLNADTQQATWISANQKPDAWTTQFIPADAKKDILPAYFPASFWKFLQSPAPAIPLVAPEVTLLDDSTSHNLRTLTLHISSPRQAATIWVYVTSNTQVLRAEVNGKQVDRRENPVRGQTVVAGENNRWRLAYWALPIDGIQLTLEVEPAGPIELRVVDQSYGLPEIPSMPYQPRPADMMPAPFPLSSDLILVSKTFTY